MIANKAVERVLGVGVVIVILSCILGEDIVIPSLGFGNEVVDVIDACLFKSLVCLHKGGIFEVTAFHKLHFGPFLSFTTEEYLRQSLFHGVAADGVAIVLHLAHIELYASQGECRCKDGGSGILFDKVGQQHTR